MQGNVLANKRTGKSTFNKNNSDYYPTPSECTQALLDFLKLPEDTVIWEPACGEGYMADVFAKNGYDVICTDKNEYGYGEVEDFLLSEGKRCDWIITNPPFSLAEEFIRKCLALHKPFALLLKSQYWHSKKRHALFAEHRPFYVLPLTWRPDFEFGERGGRPTMECMWCVWGLDGAKFTEYRPLLKPVTAVMR